MNDAFLEAGYAQGEIPLGVSPAVLSVDFRRCFTEDCIRMGRSVHVYRALEKAILLLDEARAEGVPIFHTYVEWRRDQMDLGLWAFKIPALAQIVSGSGLEEIDARLLRSGDVVIHKRKPSAFFGTGLDSMLREASVDTVVVCGVTTSGCVRATIVDAFSCGFRTVVAGDACGDQDVLAHDANLADVSRRYANVWNVDEVVTRVFKDHELAMQ